MAKKKAQKIAPVEQTTKRTPRQLTDLDKKTLTLIGHTAERVHGSIVKRVLPELKFPVRALSNVHYDVKIGHLEMGRGRKARALTVNTIKSFAQTLRLMSLSKEMIENDQRATKREAYYIS